MKGRFVVCDLETTGLNPVRNAILEFYGQIIDVDGVSIVLGDELHAINVVNDLAIDDPKVVDMHARSGLIDDIRHGMSASGAVCLQSQDFDDAVEAFLKSVGESVILVGNSPQGVDSPFLRHRYPGVQYSHRAIDTRTLMTVLGIDLPGEVKHRAKDDAWASLLVLQDALGLASNGEVYVPHIIHRNGMRSELV